MRQRYNLELVLVLLTVTFAWACQKQLPTAPATVNSGPESTGALQDKEGPHPHGGGGGGGDTTVEPETLMVSVKTAGGSVWAEPQELNNAAKNDWLHVFDSGGNGTRGKPNYANASFNTQIFMKPSDTSYAACVNEDGIAVGTDDSLRSLFDRLDQDDVALRVFDFQVDYDNPNGFSFFLFRWEEDDGRVFSVGTGGPDIAFLGDNNNDDIRNPAITRVFRISGGTVIVKELRKNKAIATLACNNEQMVEVTVAPVP